jgi:hypothetical protein
MRVVKCVPLPVVTANTVVTFMIKHLKVEINSIEKHKVDVDVGTLLYTINHTIPSAFAIACKDTL